MRTRKLIKIAKFWPPQYILSFPGCDVDILCRQGHSKDKVVYSKLSDLLPAEVVAENDPSLARPDEEEVEETTEKTRLALEQLTQSKIEAAMPVRCAEKLVRIVNLLTLGKIN